MTFPENATDGGYGVPSGLVCCLFCQSANFAMVSKFSESDARTTWTVTFPDLDGCASKGDAPRGADIVTDEPVPDESAPDVPDCGSEAVATWPPTVIVN